MLFILTEILSVHDMQEQLLEQNEKDPVPDDPKKREIAQNLWDWVRGSIRNSLEMIKSPVIRYHYLQSLKSNLASCTTQMSRVNWVEMTDKDELTMEILADKAAILRNYSLEQMRAKLSSTSLQFSRMIKEKGLTFDQLTDIYAKREFTGREFDTLTPREKVTVYGLIVEASGNLWHQPR